LVTLVEAAVGLGDMPAARSWAVLACECERAIATSDAVQPWQIESTVRQLGELARVRDVSDQDIGSVLAPLLGQSRARGVAGLIIGKVGLALSGGGFRASLFHIGVLARLAELDVLRHVEVLSCVSGGSVVGAHYYLEVRKLLERKCDREVTRDDYIDVVR